MFSLVCLYGDLVLVDVIVLVGIVVLFVVVYFACDFVWVCFVLF